MSTQVLPFLNKMMPEFDDSKYLYGFDPKKLNHFDPRTADMAGPVLADKFLMSPPRAFSSARITRPHP